MRSAEGDRARRGPGAIARAFPRGAAAFLGAFTLLNILGEWLASPFDASVWWLDLRPVPPVAARAFLTLLGAALLLWALRPRPGGWRRRFTSALVLAAIAAAAYNALRFFSLLFADAIRSAFPVPLSLLSGLVLVAIALALWRRSDGGGARWAVAGWALACALAGPLLQMACFGSTDYRRSADVAVVFGARAFADGTPSEALADRVCTACELYHQGLVARLILSGGPGDGAVDEPHAMARLARALGVPAEALILDPEGLSTEETVAGCRRSFPALGVRRALAVSHFYHLPRIQLCYQRAGLEVFTVPARQSTPLRGLPYYMAREVAAMWAYYLFPLVALIR